MTNFVQTKQTELFSELGVFFAFSDKQFSEQSKPGVKYCTVLGMGDCVPVEHAGDFAERLSAIHREGRERELAEKGIDRIIEEHLVNHECFYTYDIQPAVESLDGFDVSYEQVEAVFSKVAQKYANW